MLFAADAQKLMDYIPNLGLDRYNTLFVVAFCMAWPVLHSSDQVLSQSFSFVLFSSI